MMHMCCKAACCEAVPAGPVKEMVYQAGTGCNDVWIALIICTAIVAVTCIAKCGFLSWKKNEQEFYEKERSDKREKEKEDEIRTQKAKLMDKLTDLYGKKCEPKDKDGTRTDKNGKIIDIEQIDAYIDFLKEQLNK